MYLEIDNDPIEEGSSRKKNKGKLIQLDDLYKLDFD